MRRLTPVAILALFVSCTWAPSDLFAVITYTTLANLIPSGDAASVYAAATTPGGVQFVGQRSGHNGSFDSAPLIFPNTSTTMMAMTNPPSDSHAGFINAVIYIPGLGVMEGGNYNKLIGSTGLGDRAVI